MKLCFFGMAMLSAIGSHAFQKADSTGLPGDNFSLEGALELFKNADTPEDFEKALNTENNRVNNLDLNGDGETDYIKVIDKQEGSIHVFILQTDVNNEESQDVAVIEVERTGTDQAVLQIIGDPELYGDEVIVEPAGDERAKKKSNNVVVVNVWTWPSVRYVYAPEYRVWTSPWGWRARPVWWKPWRPVRRAVFYPYRATYRHRYVVVHHHRVVHAHRMYAPVRSTSVVVHTRHKPAHDHYRTSRTTVVKKSGSRSTPTKRGNGASKAHRTTRGRR